MRQLLPGALVALLAFPASATEIDPLDALETTVIQRETTVDGSTRSGRRLVRTLRRAQNALTAPRTSLGAELKALGRSAQLLRKPFAEDPEIPAILDLCFAELQADALAIRNRLSGLEGEFERARDLKTLRKAVSAHDRHADRALAATRIDRAVSKLRRAWKAIQKAEKALGVGPVRDFSLEDTNPHASSFGRTVSPREFLGGVSAYYFGHST